MSKDAGFHQRSFVLGTPPKVVRLRLGNRTTDDVERLIRARAPEIERLVEDAEAAFLELG